MLYRAYDRLIESQLPIPGASPASSPGSKPAADLLQSDEPDLRIHLGPDAETISPATPYHLRPDGTFTFSMERVGSYRLDPLATHLTIHPHPAATTEDLAGMLIATALPAWLWCRGDLVFHAATVILPGRTSAIALAGASGIGKSSLLLQILEHGGSIVGDDTVCLRPADSLIHASGLPAAIHLRAHQPDQPSALRRTLDVAGEQRRSSSPLAALVFLRANTGEPPGLHRLHGQQGLSALIRNLHRPAIPRLLGQTPHLLPRLAALLSLCAIYTWFLPPGTPDAATLDTLP